jgi:hypothetical protein
LNFFSMMERWRPSRWAENSRAWAVAGDGGRRSGDDDRQAEVERRREWSGFPWSSTDVGWSSRRSRPVE